MKIEHKIVVRRAHWADDHPQGEIKFNTGGTSGLVIVAVDGWNYKPYDCRKGRPDGWHAGTGQSVGMQVRISMNGPLMLTMREWHDLNEYIEKVYREVEGEYMKRGF